MKREVSGDCGIRYLNVNAITKQKLLSSHSFYEPSSRVNIPYYVLCHWIHVETAYVMKYNNLPNFMHLSGPNISPPSVPHKKVVTQTTTLSSFIWVEPCTCVPKDNQPPVFRDKQITTPFEVTGEVPWCDRAYRECHAGAARGPYQEGGEGGGRRETTWGAPLPQCDHTDCVRTLRGTAMNSAAGLQNKTSCPAFSFIHFIIIESVLLPSCSRCSYMTFVQIQRTTNGWWKVWKIKDYP